MKRALCVALLMCLPAVASAAAAFVPPPPDLDARSFVLMDYASGTILAAKEPELRTAPASITKTMTLYIVFDLLKKGRLHMDDKVLVSENAWRTGLDGSASRMFLDLGSQVAVSDLIRGVIVSSGNDAAIALAEHIAGSVDAFAALMNDYAKRLGMTHSHFVNPDGLPDDNHYSTAEDLAVLARHLIHDFPEDYPMFAEKEFTYNKIRQFNRNRLLFTDPSVDGLKTGYTDAAGYCLLASAKRNDRRLISIVMGTKSEKYRNVANGQLLNYGFQFFETDALLGKDHPALQAPVYKGAEAEIPVGTLEPVYVAAPRGSSTQLKIVPKLNAPLVAPLKAGDPVGTADIMLGDKVQETVPLVALQDVPLGGLTRRAIDQVRLWMAR
ncbi:MAG: D-alanyl-D-alanine carboxypeptidase [Nevskiaceae bacterium]|nr:MAG: D-alanyl-D-alanine carboxypeptidase [Nevskiaceae bacterium]TBR74444.1 MAG: D-alanyl-D-alanine carboxypeptidase [Nevskiaceae bacterium]